MQHGNCKAVFWGGCNTNSSNAQVTLFRNLFGDHTLIGWKGITGWQILNVVMGGFGNSPPNPAQDFFDLLGATPDDPATIKNAWLQSAIDSSWGDGTQTDDKFSVISPSGSGFKISGNSIIPDPSFP